MLKTTIFLLSSSSALISSFANVVVPRRPVSSNIAEQKATAFPLRACPPEMEGKFMCSETPVGIENRVVKCVNGYLDFANGTPCLAGKKCRAIKTPVPGIFDPFASRYTYSATCETPCTENQRRCAPGASDTVQTCIDGWWPLGKEDGSQCMGGGICDPNTPSFCRKCTEGSAQCLWSLEKPGLSFETSRPTYLTTCVNGAHVLNATCNKPGQWCDVGLFSCIECLENTKQCTKDQTLQICNQGKWTNQSQGPCPSYCSAEMGKCIDCLSGQIKCKSNSQYYYCKENNMWSTDMDQHGVVTVNPHHNEECENNQIVKKGASALTGSVTGSPFGPLIKLIFK